MIFEFKKTVMIDRRIDEVFEFFSNAENLERITPPQLKFRILSQLPIEMGEGTLIDYRLSLHKIPIRWRTLIRSWNPPYEFIDEQIRGPYTSWIHHHQFESVGENQTKMSDNVQYSLFGGKLAHFLVKKDIEKIFDFRTNVIQQIFQKQ